MLLPEHSYHQACTGIQKQPHSCPAQFSDASKAQIQPKVFLYKASQQHLLQELSGAGAQPIHTSINMILKGSAYAGNCIRANFPVQTRPQSHSLLPTRVSVNAN